MYYPVVVCLMALSLVSKVYTAPAQTSSLEEAFLNFIRSLDISKAYEDKDIQAERDVQEVQDVQGERHILEERAVSGQAMTHGGNANGAACHFPFTARGRTYNECTRRKADGGWYDYYWCSTTADYDTGRTWGKCTLTIITHGGNANGAACHFPFTARGRTHIECTNKKADGSLYDYFWCSTTRDYSGTWGKCTSPTGGIEGSGFGGSGSGGSGSGGSGGSGSGGSCGIAPLYKAANSQFIVGGNEAEKNRYPWQVYIRMPNTACGGSVIAKNWILTAAHCVKWNNRDYRTFSPSQITVLAGAHNRQEYESGQQRMIVSKVIAHEDHWEGRRHNNDIALLQLSSDLTFNDYVQPVCLPNSAPTAGDTCTATGWGATREKGAGNSVLMTVNLPILPKETCDLFAKYDWIGGALTDNMFCAGYMNGGKDTCQGDSGGPLTCESAGVATQYGIVSWGNGCARRGWPGVYVQLYKYRNWISQKTNNAV